MPYNQCRKFRFAVPANADEAAEVYYLLEDRETRGLFTEKSFVDSNWYVVPTFCYSMADMVEVFDER